MDLAVRKTRPVRVPRRRLIRQAEILLATEGWPTDVEVDLWLCSDDDIRELNSRHRGKDAPTDVLSFPQFAPGERPLFGPPVALGDVVISVDTANRQAAARGASLSQEIEWLFAHSLLHLLGYDDDTEEELEEMIAKAQAALAA